MGYALKRGSAYRNFLLATLTVAISSLCAFAVLEITARIVLSNPIPLFVPSENDRLIYELNPEHPEINAYGMRQGEFARDELADSFVIAAIGDSHTYSADSALKENAFPARLEKHLAEITGRKVKVLNFGVPGYNMAQELEVLKVKALPFQPDLIILQYCINDEHLSSYIKPEHAWLNSTIHSSALVSRAWQKLVYSRFGQTHILRHVERRFPDLLLFTPGLVGTPIARESDPAHAPHPPRAKDQVPVRYHNVVGWENLVKNVRLFGGVARDAEIPLIATGFIEHGNAELYENSGFRVYSFFDIFENRDMREFGYDPDNTATHFSDRGSDFIGRALAAYINAVFLTRSP